MFFVVNKQVHSRVYAIYAREQSMRPCAYCCRLFAVCQCDERCHIMYICVWVIWSLLNKVQTINLPIDPRPSCCVYHTSAVCMEHSGSRTTYVRRYLFGPHPQQHHFTWLNSCPLTLPPTLSPSPPLSLFASSPNRPWGGRLLRNRQPASYIVSQQQYCV